MTDRGDALTYDSTFTIGQFLDGTAAKQPAPGGGSVSALVGALSAAIGEMVLNYSVGKKGLEAHQPQILEGLAELHRARQLMIALMAEDQLAYQALSAAKKLSKDSNEYRQEYPIAVVASIRTPEAIAATGVAILNACDRLVESVNRYLLSDLAVCAELAMAAVRCGIYNVRINLSEVGELAEQKRLEEEMGRMLFHATALIRKIIPRIWSPNAS